MTKKAPVNYPDLPFRPIRKLKYRNFKEAMRHGIYCRPNGKTAETLAMEAGLDRLSDLTRYFADSPEDGPEKRGKFADIFLDLLVAMGETGLEMLDYMRDYVTLRQELQRDIDEVEKEKKAAAFIAEHGPAMIESLNLYIKTQGSKKK